MSICVHICVYIVRRGSYGLQHALERPRGVTFCLRLRICEALPDATVLTVENDPVHYVIVGAPKRIQHTCTSIE